MNPLPLGAQAPPLEIVNEQSVVAGEPPVNILVVDDEPANLLVLETLLADPGYRLVRAESADQALLALVEHDFALLILDVRMPVMSGFELAQMVKQRRKTSDVPIIFLTAYYDKDQQALEAYDRGAVDFLSKPVNPAVLRSKVAVFVELHRKTRAVTAANQALRELAATLERRVEERTSALLESDRKLQALMHSITDGLLMLDAQWRFTFINPQGARMLGRDPAALLGTPLSALFPEAGAPALWEGLRNAARGSQSVSFEVLLPAPLQRWFECHCYPSADGLSVYFHDISERREVQARQEQLLQAEQAARSESERLARVKDEFLASLSHELRTPLAAIVGWSKTISQPGTDAQMLSRGLDAIARNAEVQSQLVADLLDMGRIVSGKLRVDNSERVDLNAIATLAADTARPAALAKGLTLKLLLHDDGEPLDVAGASARLQQVASNLLSNALKFTPRGGTVTLSTARSADRVEFTVSDTGQGIEPEFLPHLFERFSQADGSAAREHGGLGLGLSIVKNLVEVQSGTVHVHSAGRNRGSTFTVRFPAPGPVEAASAPAGVAAESLHGISVLVVDDHADVLELHRRVLSDVGAAVTTAVSAQEALDCLRHGRFDVLLSDLSMPVQDGFDLIRTVRSTVGLDAAALPAAAVTAFVRAEDGERALQAGYQTCIHKPVYPATLVNAVHALARAKPAQERVPAWHVLLVEDNADLLDLMAWMLRDEGLQVTSCDSAELALAEFGKGSYDVLLTDISLKGMSGVEMARCLLAARRDTRIIFCSGYPLDYDLTDFGPNVRSLVKPFEPKDLWRCLASLGAPART